MIESSKDLHGLDAPTVIPRRKWRISLVWLVPLIAALIGLSMLVQTWITEGPVITITFHTAAGLEEGKTLVKYKDVNVGAVTAINLSEDGSRVVATVALDKDAASLAREDSRFGWCARASASMGFPAWIRCCRAHTSVWIGANRRSLQKRSLAWKVRPR